MAETDGYIAVNDVLANVQKRFFSDVSPEEYDRRTPQDVLRKLLLDAGIAVPRTQDQRDKFYEQSFRPSPALRFTGYCNEDILHLLDMLLDPEHRSQGTYVRNGATRGTTRINLLPVDYIEHLFAAIEHGLEHRGNIASLPRPSTPSRELVPQRADLLYPDGAGELKRAFCEGMQVNPAGESRGFVELFRDWVTRIPDRLGRDVQNVAARRPLISLPLKIATMAEPETAHAASENNGALGALSLRYKLILDTVLVDSSVKYAHNALRARRPMTPEIARACGTVVRKVLGEELARHYGAHYHPAIVEPVASLQEGDNTSEQSSTVNPLRPNSPDRTFER